MSSLLIKVISWVLQHTIILLYRQNMWLTNKILRSRRIVGLCIRRKKKLARSLRSLVIIYKFLVFQTQGYYCTDKICDSPTRYRDLEELYGLRCKMRKCLARSLRSLVIIYDISQVLTLLIKAISWLLRMEAHVVSINMWYTYKLLTWFQRKTAKISPRLLRSLEEATIENNYC